MSRLESKGKGTFRRTKSGSIEYRIAYYDDNNVRRIKSFTADTDGESALITVRVANAPVDAIVYVASYSNLGRMLEMML